jgi:hypothetical protein
MHQRGMLIIISLISTITDSFLNFPIGYKMMFLEFMIRDVLMLCCGQPGPLRLSNLRPLRMNPGGSHRN